MLEDTTCKYMKENSTYVIGDLNSRCGIRDDFPYEKKLYGTYMSKLYVKYRGHIIVKYMSHICILNVNEVEDI